MIFTTNSKYHQISHKINTLRKIQNFPHDLISRFYLPKNSWKHSTNEKFPHVHFAWLVYGKKQPSCALFLIYEHGRKNKWQPTDKVQVKPHSTMRSSRPSLSEEFNSSFDAILRLKNNYTMMKGVKMQESIILMVSCHYVKKRWVPSTGLVSLLTQCPSKTRNNSVEFNSLKKLIF